MDHHYSLWSHMQSHVLELRTCNALLLLNYGVLLSTVHESTAIIYWCRDVGVVAADFELNRDYSDTSYPECIKIM